MSWSVRRATVADAEELARINIAGWRETYPGIVPDTVLDRLDAGDFAASYRDVVRSPEPVAVFVAVDGERIGALCGVCPVRDAGRDAHPHRHTGELAAIYADPPARGSGAGHTVHDAGLRHLAGAGFDHAVLWVMEANHLALRFYTRHGWVSDDARRSYDVGGRAVPLVRLSRSLSA